MNCVDVKECSVVRSSKLLEEIDLLERMISDNYGNLSDIEVNQIENEIIHKYKELHNIEMKNDSFHRLTENVEDASKEETEELLDIISKLSEDDLAISSREVIER